MYSMKVSECTDCMAALRGVEMAHERAGPVTRGGGVGE